MRAVLVLSLLADLAVAQTVPEGTYRAWLDSPGGPIPFGLTLVEEEGGASALLHNAEEQISLPGVTAESGELAIPIPHYAGSIRAAISPGGAELHGTWRKRSLGADAWSELPFHALLGGGPRFAREGAAAQVDVGGRWRVVFGSSAEPAVGVFAQDELGVVTGTFLTTTGDYRYLEGAVEGTRLRLSCFDGAHAFLFDARVQPDGSLAGDFWSRDSWHETWTAVRDVEAALPDPFAETRWTGGSANALCFPDLEGNARLVGEPAFWGKARLLVLFGSWCPNCHDEAHFLAELERTYRDRGLSILGLAFELSGNFETDAAQVRAFQARVGVEYPVLLAGTAGKPDATAALGTLSSVKSFPTTVFLDAAGEVVRVHSGWAGPATGAAHEATRAEFEAQIEALLERPAPGLDAAWPELARDTWWGFPDGAHTFEVRADGVRVARRSVEGTQVLTPVHTAGDAVAIGDRLWILAPGLGRLHDPMDYDLTMTALSTLNVTQEGSGPAARRQRLITSASIPGADLVSAFADSDPEVRATGAWAAGIAGRQDLAPLLLAMAEDQNPTLRREAARGLRRLGLEDVAIGVALQRLASDPHPLVRAAATQEPRPLTPR